jgi:multidrug efflux pump subunit AcrB
VLDDIAETVVALRDGQPVLIRHVAEVGIGAAPKRGVGSHNGKPAVVLGIQKQPGANTLELTDRLDRTLADIQAGLPAGMKIERHIFRQADFIRVSIDNLLAALREGPCWSSPSSSPSCSRRAPRLITLVAIPLSLVAAILSMKALGATINTMTLGGMAIALGALVDDAIIVVENIVRRLRENLAKPEGEQRATLHVVFEATKEIQGSIVFATLIIMLVFMPLFFLSGVEGRLMVPLGFAYVVSLAASLLVAITVTPVLAALVPARLEDRPRERRAALHPCLNAATGACSKRHGHALEAGDRGQRCRAAGISLSPCLSPAGPSCRTSTRGR